MLISSDFHDYYDSILSYGIDKEVVYNRKYSLFSEKNKFPDAFKGINSLYDTTFNTAKYFFSTTIYKNVILINHITIGFCGKIYFCYDITDDNGTRFLLYTENDFEKFFDTASFTDKRKLKDAKDGWLNKDKKRIRIYECISRKSFRKLKQDVNINKISLFESAPIWTYTVCQRKSITNLELNPCLKHLNFQRIIDPATAFQELFMFIGCFLSKKENEIVHLSDNDMRDEKGFDEKSFKNIPPGMKKLRRASKRQKNS